MKERIKLFFEGMILGLAMIIPGLSGGTLAISMGLYEKIVKTVSHFFSDFKNNFLFALNLGLGALVSLALSVLVLNYVFDKYPVPGILFFIGLIIGSVPSIFKKIEIKKTVNVSNIIFLLIGACLVLSMTFLNSGGKEVILTNLNFIGILKLVGVGFVAAATVVIPGISGSLLLMVMGYYEPLLNTISQTIKFINLGNNLSILIPFGLGIVIGVIVLVKVIEYLLDKHELKTYYAITGFLIASIIEVFLSLFAYALSVPQIIIGVILLIIGVYLSLKVFKND